MGRIRHGVSFHLVQLSAVQCFFRAPKPLAYFRSDFHNHQDIFVSRHQINFRVSCPVVLLDHLVAFFLQILPGKIFPQIPRFFVVLLIPHVVFSAGIAALRPYVSLRCFLRRPNPQWSWRFSAYENRNAPTVGSGSPQGTALARPREREEHTFSDARFSFPRCFESLLAGTALPALSALVEFSPLFLSTFPLLPLRLYPGPSRLFQRQAPPHANQCGLKSAPMPAFGTFEFPANCKCRVSLGGLSIRTGKGWRKPPA